MIRWLRWIFFFDLSGDDKFIAVTDRLLALIILAVAAVLGWGWIR